MLSSADALSLTRLVCIALGLLAILAVFLIRRRSGRWLPKTALQWLGAVASLAVLAVGVLGVLVIGWVGSLANEPIKYVGRPLPPVRFRSVADDTPGDVADFRGRVVLLNYWATWCAPCVAELPDLDRLAGDYRARGLVVILISDEPRATLQAFAAKHPVATLNGYLSPTAATSEPFFEAIQVRPVSFVIDRQGIVREVVVDSGNYARFVGLVSKFL